MERSGELEGSGTVLGCGDVPRPGALSGSGVSPEVGERWVAAAGAEGSEVSSLGAVGGGVGESLEVGAGAAAASGEGPVRPGLVEVRWALPREAATGLGGTAEVASGVASGVEAAVRMSGGAEAEVSGGSAGPGAAEAGGEGAAGLVLAVVGRSRRSGHRLLWEPGGGKTDGRGQAAPPTPQRVPPSRRCDQWGGTGARDVTGRQQTSPGPSAPPPSMLRCLQAPPGVLPSGGCGDWRAGRGGRGGVPRDAGWWGGGVCRWCGRMREGARGMRAGDLGCKRGRNGRDGVKGDKEAEGVEAARIGGVRIK